MISSVTSNLKDDRNQILKTLNKYKLFNCTGSTPFNNKAISQSSFNATLEMAENCNLYILILSNLFGYELENGKSATEVEFDAAYSNDPTKVLVLYKDTGAVIEPKQLKFVNKVTDYYSGYWRTTYSKKKELKSKLNLSVSTWLKERASLNHSLNYFDHFIRIAKNIKPEPTANIYYRVTDTYIELAYSTFGKREVIHFDKKLIYEDFWNSIKSLRNQFDVWKAE